jgi:hypothetical protein
VGGSQRGVERAGTGVVFERAMGAQQKYGNLCVLRRLFGVAVHDSSLLSFLFPLRGVGVWFGIL